MLVGGRRGIGQLSTDRVRLTTASRSSKNQDQGRLDGLAALCGSANPNRPATIPADAGRECTFKCLGSARKP
jgi:hypothetical protein